MPFYLAWLCKKGQCTKIFFLLLTHLSNIFAPYIKNFETYFTILICFEFWPLCYDTSFERSFFIFTRSQKLKGLVYLLGVLVCGQSTPKSLRELLSASCILSKHFLKDWIHKVKHQMFWIFFVQRYIFYKLLNLRFLISCIFFKKKNVKLFKG